MNYQLLKRHEIFITTALIVIFSYFCFSVSLYPITPNDSVVYLLHFDLLSEWGMVQWGYRQVGYPLFLGGLQAIAGILDTEVLFLSSFVQRMTFFLASVLFIKRAKLFAIPGLLILCNPNLIIYTNILYPEGLIIPLVIVLINIFFSIKSSYSDFKNFSLILVILFLTLIKFQYVVFAALPVFLYSTQGLSFKKFLYRLAFLFVPLCAISLSFCIENFTEYDKFWFSFKTARTKLFAVYEGKREVIKDLAPSHYHGGNIFNFVHKVESNIKDHSKQERILNEKTKKILDMLEISPQIEKLRSMFYFFFFPRGNDFDWIRFFLNKNRRSGREYFSSNFYIKGNGLEGFLKRFNNNKKISYLTLGKKTINSFDLRNHVFAMILLTIAFIFYMVVVLKPLDPKPIYLFLFLYIFVSIIFGFHYCDILRYQLPHALFFILGNIMLVSNCIQGKNP